MKTSELTGAALDWAVAKCAGELDEQDYYLHESTGAFMLERGEVSWVYSPSTNWAQGGPIIAQHIFLIEDIGDYEWEATAANGRKCRGDTVLEAVCRAYVASKLGDEIDLPDEEW